MCRIKSGILLRGRAYVPDHDSHDQMLRELGIQDDYIGASEKFVRFELSPRDDNLSTDVSTWAMKVDQDIVPAWFDADREKYEGIITEAVSEWAEKHIIKEGKHEQSEGTYYLFNDAEITLMDNAQATLMGNAQATLRGNAQATLLDNAQAMLRDNAQATLRDNAQATLLDNAQATLRDNAQATLRDNASIGNSDIFDNAIVISHEDSKVYVSKKWDMEVIK